MLDGAGRPRGHRDVAAPASGRTALSTPGHLATSTSCDALALARLDARQVQQVDDELAHAVHADEAAIDHLRFVGLGPVRRILQVALDGVERRLELVGEHGDELEADLALLLGQLRACAAA